MVEIEIHIPRPLQTATWLIAGTAFCVWVSMPAPATELPEGGSGTVRAAAVVQIEGETRELRLQQAVLERREEILRYQLQILLKASEETTDAAVLSDLDAARDHFIELSGDRRKAEEELLETLHELWEARGFALTATRDRKGSAPRFEWPVEPLLGLSATFEDSAYEKRFGMPHHAIDIPVDQESPVYAAADGVVLKVSDNGMGFSALTIEHSGGIATLYGHVTEFLVEEGQQVSRGQRVALSGGMPGTPGAGLLSTGPHLHFEVIKNGEDVDPLNYLPEYEGL